MTIKQFIEKAIEGGYRADRTNWSALEITDDGAIHRIDESVRLSIQEILFEPEAWKAVGKVEGWKGAPVGYSYWSATPWLSRMHRMIDALAEGQTIEQYLETL